MQIDIFIVWRESALNLKKYDSLQIIFIVSIRLTKIALVYATLFINTNRILNFN